MNTYGSLRWIYHKNLSNIVLRFYRTCKTNKLSIANNKLPILVFVVMEKGSFFY
jgi:hypothetical protein